MCWLGSRAAEAPQHASPNATSGQLRREYVMRQHGLERHLKRTRLLRHQGLPSKTGSGRDLLTDNVGLYVEAVQFLRTRQSFHGGCKEPSRYRPHVRAHRRRRLPDDPRWDLPATVARRVVSRGGPGCPDRSSRSSLEVSDDAWPAVKEEFNALRGRGYLDEIVELLVDAVDHFDGGLTVCWDQQKQAVIGSALVELAIESTSLFRGSGSDGVK